MSGFGYNILGFGGGGGPAPPEVDDEFNRVSFLSHFDGANNGVNNAFDDGSASNHTITANGNVTQGSFGPFARPDGDFSFVNAATDDDSFKVNSSDNFDLTDPFTVEGWVFLPNLSANKLLFGRENNYWITHDYQGIAGAAGKFGFNYQNNGNWAAINASADTVTNQWYFLQATYVGTTATFYVNGASQGTSTIGTPSSNTDKPFYVLSGPGDGATATASNVRVSSVARASTLPTTAFTSDSDTELLVCQSNRFVDNGPDGHTITVTAGTSVSAFGPFLTNAAYNPAVNGASMYAPLYTDYLRIPNSSEFELDANFSVEFWVNLDTDFNATSGDTSVMFWANNNSQTQIAQNNDGFYFYRGELVIGNTDVLAKAKQWNHVALCRSGSVISLYCNGARIGTASYTSTVDFSDAYVMTYVPNSDQYGANGYMSDLRILKGSSAYDASQTTLTVPTASLTAITNTKLLLNMADGQAINSAAQNNMTLIGDAKISTGQAKFGATSMYFDGTGDYAVVENFGPDAAAEFTIEFWVYPSALDPKNGLFQQSFANGGLSMRIETDGTLTVSKTGVSNYLGTSTTISANAWAHIALVYYNGVLKCYINGTADSATSTTSVNWVASGGEFILGARFFNGSIDLPMTGYLDEFRISAFARYTSNFTVQAEQFADQGQA